MSTNTQYTHTIRQTVELQGRIQPRSAQYIRHASKNSLTDKDAQLFERIQSDFERIAILSDEKVQMAKKLKDLLTKHSNRLQVELGRITHPGDYTRSAIPYSTPSVPIVAHHIPAIPIAPSAPVAYNPVVKTPMTSVLANMQVETAVVATPAPVAVAAPVVVPIVLEPASTAVSAAPSPASAPANKRKD
jgi:hypothetical protein